MGRIPQTLTLRYHDMSVVCVHTNTRVRDARTARPSETHRRMHFLSGQEVCQTAADGPKRTQKGRFHVSQRELGSVVFDRCFNEEL